MRKCVNSIANSKIHKAAITNGTQKIHMATVSVGCHTKNPHGSHQCRLSYKKSKWQPSVSVTIQKIHMVAVSLGCHTKNPHGSLQCRFAIQRIHIAAVSVGTKNPYGR